MEFWVWYLVGCAAVALGVWATIVMARRESSSAVLAGHSSAAPVPTAQDADAPDEPRWWSDPGATLVEIANPAVPELSTEARAVEQDLASKDIKSTPLPPLARTTERVLPRLHDPNVSLTAIARDLADDQALAVEILRMANSPLYRGTEKITALRSAVVRLGANAIRTLLMSVSVRSATIGQTGAKGSISRELADMIWERSVASACIMHGLSKFTTLDQDDAFLLGLLHDVGNVVVLQSIARWERVGRLSLSLEEFEFLSWETHEEFGGEIAEAWNLPSEINAVIGDHHAYPAPDDPLRTQRLQLHVTDMISSLLGFGLKQPYNLLASRPVHDLGLANRQDFVAFLDKLPEFIDRTIESFGGGA